MKEQERVVLVDRYDREMGTAEKLEAHRSGALHRAFSVFVLDSSGRLLLQRRADGKYHTSGLWSNTCCGHPRPGEPVEEAARRRLREEMGFDCRLRRRCGFVYRADVAAGLEEHEYDHVFVGYHDEDPVPDPEEASDWRWAPITEVESDVQIRPENYTPWFPLALEQLLASDRMKLRVGGS